MRVAMANPSPVFRYGLADNNCSAHIKHIPTGYSIDACGNIQKADT